MFDLQLDLVSELNGLKEDIKNYNFKHIKLKSILSEFEKRFDSNTDQERRLFLHLTTNSHIDSILETGLYRKESRWDYDESNRDEVIDIRIESILMENVLKIAKEKGEYFYMYRMTDLLAFLKLLQEKMYNEFPIILICKKGNSHQYIIDPYFNSGEYGSEIESLEVELMDEHDIDDTTELYEYLKDNMLINEATNRLIEFLKSYSEFSSSFLSLNKLDRENIKGLLIPINLNSDLQDINNWDLFLRDNNNNNNKFNLNIILKSGKYKKLF